MDDFLRCLVGMFAVIAPIGAVATVLDGGSRNGDRTVEGRSLLVGAPTVALVTLSVFALLSGPLLDWLNVSPESFQFAAGAAMVPLALRLVVAGDSTALPTELPRYSWLVPFAIPMLAGPSSIIAVISYAARFGAAETIAASALALAGTGALFASLQWLKRLPSVVLQTGARLSGGLLIVIAVELAVNGVRSV